MYFWIAVTMLSILIPTYNYDVTTLVKQVHQQCIDAGIVFEIIVNDDASTKQDIISKNKSIGSLKNTYFYENSTNKGRTANRHILTNKAAYSWILFLDADILPTSENFIKNYLENIDKNVAVVFGGIDYETSPPSKNKMLRWKYGVAREARSVSERQKQPYHTIVSGCILIKKEYFLKANRFLENLYGIDILFAENLKKLNLKILHINNPVIHLGLEDNKTFIKKSLAAVASTVSLEEKNLLGQRSRPLQVSYLKLKKWRLTTLFKNLVGLFKNRMLRNFESENPNLFWFDLYRLLYYIELKSQKNA